MAQTQAPLDITIIGAGPAGLFAAYYAGFRDMKTLILDALPEPGGQLAVLYPEKYIYDVAGYPKVLAKDLVKSLFEQASRYNPTVAFGERAISLKRNDGILKITTDKNAYETKTCLITAGVGSFSPNKLPLPGIEKFEGKGIYYFVKDKDIFRQKNLLIVGGGDSAVDWALNLKDIAKSITLIHRRDQFRAHEKSVQEMMNSNVHVRCFYELKGVQGNSVVESATIYNNQNKEETKIPVDAILVNIGFKANLGPIAEWGLAMENRSIKVNGKMETNIPGVYAAGDVALPLDSVKLNLIAVGFAQATIAVNVAKKFADPKAQYFPGHSSEKSPT
jgi:thioredoxin reductase